MSLLARLFGKQKPSQDTAAFFGGPAKSALWAGADYTDKPYPLLVNRTMEYTRPKTSYAIYPSPWLELDWKGEAEYRNPVQSLCPMIPALDAATRIPKVGFGPLPFPGMNDYANSGGVATFPQARKAG